MAKVPKRRTNGILWGSVDPNTNATEQGGVGDEGFLYVGYKIPKGERVPSNIAFVLDALSIGSAVRTKTNWLVAKRDPSSLLVDTRRTYAVPIEEADPMPWQGAEFVLGINNVRSVLGEASLTNTQLTDRLPKTPLTSEMAEVAAVAALRAALEAAAKKAAITAEAPALVDLSVVIQPQIELAPIAA